MIDVFNAMKAHVDAITELLTVNEIENKAKSDLEAARLWLTKCEKDAMTARRNENESGILLRAAVNFHRLNAVHKSTPSTKPAPLGISANEALKNL